MKVPTDELKDEAICAACVGETYLKGLIESDGEQRQCRYCDETGPAFTLEEMADRVEAALQNHYQRTPQDPNVYERAAMNDPESSYDWYREGEQTVHVIMDAADISEEAASDIQEILDDRHSDFESATMGEETEFSEDAHYEEIMPGDDEWREGWREFERSIKTEARFFSRVAAGQLAALFDDIDQLRTSSGRPLIVEAGPNTQLTHFFRARVFQSDSKLEVALVRPDHELAAPPPHLAAAGRMNAKGISTFYGATTPQIALAEVRPPVGSQVAIARFNLNRPLRLLDLNALQEIHVRGSIFNPQYARELGRMTFLRSLCGRISRPVMPDDQDSEYLPTQAVADYLATEGKVPLDGILFPSVQAGGDGLNVVLFHKASRCEELQFPKGTEISARTGQMSEDGWEREYTVLEEVPPEQPAEEPAPVRPFYVAPEDYLNLSEWANGDYRDPSMRIAPESIHVHLVNSVIFDATDRPVRRHRWTKTDPQF